MLKRNLIIAAIASLLLVFSINGFSQPKSKAAKAKTTNTATKSVKKNRICPWPMCGGLVNKTKPQITSQVGIIYNTITNDWGIAYYKNV